MTKIGELLLSFNNCQEVITGELPHLAGKTATAIGKEDLGFAVATGVKEDIATGGMAGVIFKADVELKVSQGNPRRFPAPSSVNNLIAKGQDLGERSTGLWGSGLFKARRKGEWSGCDLQVIHRETPFDFAWIQISQPCVRL